MTAWLIAAAIGIAAAILQYSRLSAPSALRRAGLAALRTLALTLAIALLLDAPLGRPRVALPWVFVDASLSMTRENAPLWRAAWDSALAAARCGGCNHGRATRSRRRRFTFHSRDPRCRLGGRGGGDGDAESRASGAGPLAARADVALGRAAIRSARASVRRAGRRHP